MMKIVFFGSDDFALAHLKSLVSDRYHIVACVTQPDRPKGRGMKIIFSPVKEFALKNNIKVFQPETLKDEKVVEILKGFQADVFVVISYGHLLPKDVLEIPRLGALNVHPSLLPQYRGAAPMNWAIIQGEKETAISIIRLNTSLDAGDIVIQEKVKIEEDDTAVTLRTRIMGLGGKLLKKAIDLLAEGKTAFISQDEKQATKAPKLTKEMGLID
ncbi:MAG TPA: methionyl-tRNA formyltransferase, partial [Candidatus Omnitrophota bacterium]|nr:methionyl-tRNA formyltransferase [Candidatus Omnitrophota bacterium]